MYSIINAQALNTDVIFIKLLLYTYVIFIKLLSNNATKYHTCHMFYIPSEKLIKLMVVGFIEINSN